MTRVDFIIIGAQKCGTTSLATQVARHRDVSFCRLKEPHFFSRAGDWRRELPTYHRLFGADRGKMRGEASTSYTFVDEYPHTAQRLHEYNHELRLIYIMRHPLARIRSHLQHDVLAGRIETGDVERAALFDARYVDRSRFAHQLEPYLQQFALEQIHLVLLEDFATNPQAVQGETLRFLGLPVSGMPEFDPGPQNVSAAHGHLRRFLGYESLRERGARLPTPVVRAARWVMRHPARPLLYRRARGELALSATVQMQLWEIVEEDVRRIERHLARDLSKLWAPPAQEARRGLRDS